MAAVAPLGLGALGGVLKFGISQGQVSLGGRGAPSAHSAGDSALILDLFQQL